MTTTQQFCTFRVGDLFLGVEVERVQEVLRHLDMTPVPLAPPVIRGLINLRGQIVTAIDVRTRLDLPPRTDGRLPMNVVLRSDDEPVSLLVDEIGDVIEVEAAAVEPPPDTLGGITRTLVRSVFKLSDRLLLVLDDRAAVHHGPTGPDRGA